MKAVIKNVGAVAIALAVPGWIVAVYVTREPWVIFGPLLLMVGGLATAIGASVAIAFYDWLDK